MSTATIDNKVTQIIANIRNLPTPPIVFHQIQKVLNDPYVSAGQIASILAEDPAMSVKVLKLTNSAFYGLSREVESVKQAVVIVGLEAIKNLVLSASVLDMFKSKDFDQDFQETFWRHSLGVGFCARIVAKKARGGGMVDPDAAFSSGMLHDIGKVILNCFLKDEWEAYSKAREADNVSPTFEVERRVIGYDHANIGSVLAVSWKLPQRLADAIAFHHCPSECPNEDVIPYVIHFADFIAKKTFADADETNPLCPLEQGALEHLQFAEDDIETFVGLLRDEYVKAETFMKMAGIG